MTSGSFQMERACALSWFSRWNSAQRNEFAQKFKTKLAQGVTLDTLMDDLEQMSLAAGLASQDGPTVFQCQMRILDGWIAKWTQESRSNFIAALGSIDPSIATYLVAS